MTLVSLDIGVGGDAKAMVVKRLDRELIYEAIVDDEVMRALPYEMIRSYDARSCTMHWRPANGATAVIVSHNNYFTDRQFDDYVENFAHTDLWSLAGARPDRLNRVHNCDDIVPRHDLMMTPFYNDWIRRMGDDTLHCAGAALNTEQGLGFVGVHRGAGQGAFSERNVSALKHDLPHLRRMLIVRARLAAIVADAAAARGALDCIDHAMIVLDRDSRVLQTNQAGEDALRAGYLLTVNGTAIAAYCDEQSRLRAAVAHTSLVPETGAQALPLTLAGGERVHCTLAPIRVGDAWCTLLLLQRRNAPDVAMPLRLRQLFGLSQAEAEVMAGLSEGLTLGQIADARRSALATVRTQLKVALQKMDCRRQSQAVSIVKGLVPIRPN